MPFSCAGLLSHLRGPSDLETDSKDILQTADITTDLEDVSHLGNPGEDSEASHTANTSSDSEISRKAIKRPFSSVTTDLISEEVLPEVVDVMEAVLDSLTSFNIDAVESSSREEEIDDISYSADVREASGDEKDISIVEEFLVGSESVVKVDVLDFENVPIQVTGCWGEFVNKIGDNYTRGCKWAPDGSCLVTCSNDNILRLFNLPPELWDTSQWEDIPEMQSVVKIKEGELVYDYCWYPLMNSQDPSSCCLASCSKTNSTHLWDGFTGELRCSYRAYDQMDEVTAPHCISFDADGQRLYCGFEKMVRIFNVDLPGRQFQTRPTFAKKSGQSGIISCFAFTPANKNISAAGSFNKTIGIYSEPDGNLQALVAGQQGGVTQVQFSPDGRLLYSGGRKDPEILCWDVRNIGNVLYSLRRSCKTNQRMQFDISRCGRYVISGNHNGVISVWDTLKSPKEISPEEFLVLEPTQIFMGHNDCVNGISLHPSLPLLCSTSGQRHFPSLLQDDEDSMFESKIGNYDNSLRMWWVGKCS